MNTNKIIQKVTFIASVACLIAIIHVGINMDKTIWYDIVLALFGSLAVAYCTAKITYMCEIKRIRRNIISNMLQIQKNFKKILFDYRKTLDYFEKEDFETARKEIHKLIDEYMSYTDALKLETGKNINDLIQISEVVNVYASFVRMNGDLHSIGMLVEEANKQLAYTTYIQCGQDDKKTVEMIKKILRQEYGKEFESINSIGLC